MARCRASYNIKIPVSSCVEMALLEQQIQMSVGVVPKLQDQNVESKVDFVFAVITHRVSQIFHVNRPLLPQY
jgi:hypothetical protein